MAVRGEWTNRMLYLALAGVSFGSIGLFVNLIGNEISTLLIVSIRLLATAGIIYSYQAARGARKEIRLDSRRDYYIAIGGGIFGFALTFSMYLKSLILIPVSEAVFLHYVAFPFSTIVYSHIYLDEKITKYEILPLAGTIAGVFMIYNVGFSGELSSIFGYTIAFLSGITYTTALLVLKDLGKKKTTLQALFWPTLFGGMALLPISLIAGVRFTFSGSTIAPLLGLVFVATLMGYSLFAKGLQETRAGLSSIVLIIIEPLSAVLLAILFLGEKVPANSAIGGGLIVLSGIVLYAGNQSRTQVEQVEG
jgi:DME family drug/metabolite transporter